MAAEPSKASVPENSDAIKPIILEKIQELLNQLNVHKIYFVDDAIEQDTGREKFIGIVQAIINMGKAEALKDITLQGLDLKVEEEIIIDKINEQWDNIKPGKQLKYFEKVYNIIGQEKAIQDLNVSKNLQEYFSETPLEFLTPNKWDEEIENISNQIPEGKRIIVMFDQNLHLANGRFEGGTVKGENLISELKQKNISPKVIVALLTHTVTQFDEELPERKRICESDPSLNVADFFVLSKKRLDDPALFSDGLKKVCLNTFCEKVKTETINIIQEAQAKTIDLLEKLDTYDFDFTVLKSSFNEGVWEPETLLRINDVIFRDSVRRLMIDKNYVPEINDAVCSARDISRIEFLTTEDSFYRGRAELRHMEIYESEDLLNKLRRPIDNGDIFEVTEGEKKGKIFVLVAQECDLMVRSGLSDQGTRGARHANLIEIESFTLSQLNAEISRKYNKDISTGKFKSHFYADKFKLEYFGFDPIKIGLALFSKLLIIDLNVLDLIVFNEAGEAEINLSHPAFEGNFHNHAWKIRHKLILEEFKEEAAKYQKYLEALECIKDGELKNEIGLKFSHLFSFIDKVGVQANFDGNTFKFGLKRISRLRMPYSKYLLDRYFNHLSRVAELHDFAQ